MSDTIRYRSVPGSNDRMVRFIAQFEGYLAKRLAREDSIANHTFAHTARLTRTVAVSGHG